MSEHTAALHTPPPQMPQRDDPVNEFLDFVWEVTRGCTREVNITRKGNFVIMRGPPSPLAPRCLF